jgi:D-lactate dehydrogenase (cytochrome)
VPAPLPHAATNALTDLLGSRFATDRDSRRQRSRDESYHAAGLPQAVARPQSADEVATVARICHAHRLPLVPFGTGTAVEGGVVALNGGISLDLRSLNRIISVQPDDLYATVGAGLTRMALNRFLAAEHPRLYFAVDPGADATLGGMAATRASGSAALGYGTMRENVLGLSVVLADGTPIPTGGRTRKSAAGYDLTRLFVGSEGTLGIITELTLRLTRHPKAVAAAVCPFDDLEAAVDTAIAVIGAGIPVARLELLDKTQMEAVRRYSNLDYKAAPTLFFEFHGTDTGVAESAKLAQELAATHGGDAFAWAVDAAQRQRLWQARYDAYHAARALRPGAAGYVTDVCVPISRLAEAIRRARKRLAQTGLQAPILGHVGDGNFHVVCLVDPDDPDELAQARSFGEDLVDIALDLGGTCSGEHGIGLGKIDALKREHGQGVEVMRAIKNALDPHGLMNPGKVLSL